MKKAIMIMLLIASVVVVNAQEKCAGCLIEQTTLGANNMVWENDTIRFAFTPRDLFWTVKIENKTNEKIICNWDNTLFIRNKKSSGIIFDNTIRLKKDESKGTSTIASGTEISKEIFPLENWWDTGAYPVFKKKSIAKEGDMIVRLIFSISHGEQSKDYEFSFKISVAPKG